MTRWIRRFVLLTAGLVVATPLEAQGLRSRFEQLFVFGSGDVQLFLPGTADPNNPASIQQHGAHFIPASVGANGAIINFIASALAASTANTPISAASAGTTFRFEGGMPVATSGSAGPLFAERAQTLGRGRVFAGFNRNTAKYKSLRGAPLEDIRLIFTHENVTEASSPGCSATAGGDCNQMGVPNLENDLMLFNLSLDIEAAVTSFFISYGLTDRIDVSFAVPLVSVSMRGNSSAEVVPFGGPQAVHFFAGTPASPVLQASRSIGGSATGIGDVATRLKVNLSGDGPVRLGFLVDGRFATGSEEDLLGTGNTAARALAIVSARFGNFSPHANVGYLMRSGEFENDAVLATVGFDHLLAPRATLAFEMMSELQAGDSKLRLPSPVGYQAPFARIINPSAIPEARDNLVNASLGAKFKTYRELTTVLNGIVPLNRGGIRPNVLWTVGVEYSY
jgi:hypothetical protein